MFDPATFGFFNRPIADRGTRSLALGMALVAFLVVGASRSAADPYTESLSHAELFAEARAAYHLGYWAADFGPGSGAGSAPSLIDELLARASVPDALTLRSIRLKLYSATRRGDAAGFDAIFAALPSPLPGLNAAATARQKALWRMMHDAERGAWAEVDAALAAFPLTPAPTGEALADLQQLSARAAIRRRANQAAGYVALAEVVAGAASWGIADPYFDPYYASREFSALDSLESWELVTQVLDRLNSAPADNALARRRWFEILAPSFDPTQTHFTGASDYDMAAVYRAFLLRAPSYPPAAGSEPARGLPKVLACALHCHDLRLAGKFRQIGAYVEALPGTVEGVPDQVWQDHKLSWKVLGLTGMLAFSDLVTLKDSIGPALARLPADRNSLMAASVGVALLRTGDDAGLVWIGKYFRAEPREPRINQLIRREMLSAGRAAPVQAFLDELNAGQPGPEAQIAKAYFLLNRGPRYFEGEALRQKQLEAVRDGARAIDRLERTRAPEQVQLRGEIVPAMAAGVERLADREAMRRFLAQSDGPISANQELDAVAGDPLSGLPAPSELVISFSLLERMAAQLGELRAEESDAAAAAVPAAALAAAVKKLPSEYRNPREVRAARLAVAEALRRGRAALDIPAGEWELVKVQGAILGLGKSESFDQSLAALQARAQKDDDVSNPQAREARRLATVSANALTTMDSIEAFLWGISWATLIEERKAVAELGFLQAKLAENLLAALGRPAVQAYLSDPAHPPMRSASQRMNVGFALGAAERYEQARGVFAQVAADSSLPPGGEIRSLANSWEMWSLVKAAEIAETPAHREAKYKEALKYGLAHTDELSHSDSRRDVLANAIIAAEALKDDESVNRLKALRDATAPQGGIVP